MGKRKAKAKPPPKKAKATLPSYFNCLFCNHEGSISVKMDKKAHTGELSCKVCGQQFQTAITSLSDPVDVYSDWVDACDSVAKEATSLTRGELYDDEDDSKRMNSSTAVLDSLDGNEDDGIDPEIEFDAA